MYSDSTRMGHYRFIHQNTDDYCYCLHCVQYGPTLYQGGPGGYRPPPTHPDHPELDLRGDISLPPFPVEPEDIEPGLEKCERGGEGRGDGGGGEGGEGEGSDPEAGAGWGVSGHSAPQRRPVFTGPGQHGQPQPGQFSPSHPWNYNPAHWTCPVEPGLGLIFYSPVKEQCGYVGQGGGGTAGTGIRTHPFNSNRNASASSPPLDPANTQFRGQRTKHRQASYSYGPEKPIWDQSKYRLERQASYSPQEQHRQASLGLEKQVWGQSNHRLERQNSFSPQEIHSQVSYIYSPEDKLTKRQLVSYGPEQKVWGQLKHRQTSYSYSPEEQVWGYAGDEHDHLDRCVPLEQKELHPHMPNGHSGGGGPSPRHVYSQGVGDRTNYQERTTRLKAGGAVCGAGVDSCNGRHVPAGSGSVQTTFFSTEVPQKQLVSQPRQRSHCGPGLGHRTPSHGATGPVHGATIGREERFNQRAKQSASQGVNQNQGGDPDLDPQRQRVKQKDGQGSVRKSQCSVWENQCHVRENKGSVRQKEGLVREQIRQVVSDLEGVLGGLKQVHVEMKEVVEQIDLLTANIDLVEGSCNSSPHGGDAIPNPRDCRVLMYNQKTSTGEQMYTHKIRTVDLKTNGDQGFLYRDPDHTVTIQTTSPSHVLTASVIKTNRVGVTALSPLSPSPSKDSKQERLGLNKDPPIPGPSRDINHVTQTPGLEQIPSLPLLLRTHTPIPTAMVGYSVPSRRSQKPPLYPHPNGQVERLSKGLAPPPYPAQSALPVLPHLAQPPYPTHPNHPALPPSALKTPSYLEKSRPSSSMV